VDRANAISTALELGINTGSAGPIFCKAPIAKAMCSSWTARASCPRSIRRRRAAPAAAIAVPVPQAGERAAQQARRGRARVIGAVAQVSGQDDLSFGAGRHVQSAHGTCPRWLEPAGTT